jgi:hypothetical protein
MSREPGIFAAILLLTTGLTDRSRKFRNLTTNGTNYTNYTNLQNSVSFAEALAVFRPTGCKTAFFKGYSFKTKVLKEPLVTNIFCYIFYS